eukprot:2515499-Prymnesium_polylepis.1
MSTQRFAPRAPRLGHNLPSSIRKGLERWDPGSKVPLSPRFTFFGVHVYGLLFGAQTVRAMCAHSSPVHSE